MKLPSTEDFSKLSTPELYTKLAQSLQASATAFYRAAAIWAELNRRGESLQLSGALQWLPRIARGELAAEAVIAFAGQQSLITSLAGMPIDEQRKYAAGETITVAAFAEDGKTTTEAKPLAALSAKEVKLAVDQGQIRPIKAQLNSLKHSRTVAATAPHHSAVTVRPDLGAGVIVIGRARVAPQEIAAALRSLGWRLERIERESAGGTDGARAHA